MPSGAYVAETADALRAERVRALAAPQAAQRGGLLPALHAVQAAFGHIADADVPVLADVFNLSRAEVHGVVTYYHHFRRQPAGRHVLQLCRAEACQACGGDALAEAAAQQLRCAEGQTRADGGITLEAVYCLGLCAAAPALAIDGRLHARVTPQRLRALIAALETGPDTACGQTPEKAA
jgi:formate dehydrogenase subunit gamma